MEGFTTKKGFTLIELLVSIAAFSLIIVAISGIFTSVINAHRRIINVQNTQEPARYLLESMAKEIRMSTINSEATIDPQGDASLSINNPAGENIIYAFANNALTKGADIVSPASVEINGKFFIVSGSSAAQAKVTIVMSIKSKGANPAYQTAINLQSTITARGY